MFFVMKRKISRLNSEQRDPQENNFLLEAEGIFNCLIKKLERRKAKIAEEQRKKREEDEKLRQERESKMIQENEVSESNNHLTNELNIDSTHNLISKKGEDRNIDKLNRLDPNYFNSQTNIMNLSSNYLADRIQDDKKEIINFKNNMIMNINQNYNNPSTNFVESENVQNNNQNPPIVMRKIILLDPEVKNKKDENSNLSMNLSNNCKLIYHLLFRLK